MSRLYLDIETYCDLDLSKCGVHAYAAHPSFDVTLIGYAVNDEGSVSVVDTVQRKRTEFMRSEDPDSFGHTCGIGDDLLNALKNSLTDPGVEKVAHNAAFEMTCLEKYFGIEIDPRQWTDTMALANYAGLPASLSALSDVLSLGEKGKKSIGTQLINLFAKPYSRKKGERKRRIHPFEEPAKWAEFIKYNRFDIEAEILVYQKLKGFTKNITSADRDIYCLDHAINRRGIRIDTDFVKSAVAVSEAVTTPDLQKLKDLTDLSNPNSTPALKQWLAGKGIVTDKLTKELAGDLISQTDDPDVKEALRLKFSLSKASVKKYDAMLRAECPDERIKGAFQYYGASRSGRWAGRLVQLQNLRRNSIPDLDVARELVRDKDLEGLRMAYDIPGLDVSEILGQLVRTAFIPSEGNKFIVADFSAIEARVIAWLAREKWRQDVFAHDGDIYKSSYSQAFGVPIEKVDKSMRQKGKIMELALGYGGSVGALKAFGADKLGMDDEALKYLVDKWRAASPYITGLWKNVETLARLSVEKGEESKLAISGKKKLSFERAEFNHNNALLIGLPSGRSLCYQDARLVQGKFGPQISYMDVGMVSRKYERTLTHGGKLVENITQAVARDCLAEAMLRLDRAGYEIVAHIHDEVIIDADPHMQVSDVEKIMGDTSDTYPELHLSAHGYEGSYYYKD